MEQDSEALERQFDIYISLLTNRAQCYLIRNDLSKSLKDCDKAISLKPENPKPYFRKVQVLKKMEDWRAALQTVNLGMVYAPDDQSYRREKEQIEVNIKEIRSRILQGMRISELPPDQIFCRVIVRDDIDIEAETAKKQNPLSTSSKPATADQKSEASTTPLQKKIQEVVPSAGIAPRSENTSEFMALKNIDGASKNRPHDDEDAEEEPAQPKVSQTGQKPASGPSRRVRFTHYSTPSTKKIKRTAPLKSILKKTSNVRAFLPSEDARLQTSTSIDEEKVLKASIKNFLDANRSKIALIKSPSQFVDLWKSFKSDAHARELILSDLGSSRIVDIFSKGLEFDLFKELFLFLMYASMTRVNDLQTPPLSSWSAACSWHCRRPGSFPSWSR